MSNNNATHLQTSIKLSAKKGAHNPTLSGILSHSELGKTRKDRPRNSVAFVPTTSDNDKKESLFEVTSAENNVLRVETKISNLEADVESGDTITRNLIIQEGTNNQVTPIKGFRN